MRIIDFILFSGSAVGSSQNTVAVDMEQQIGISVQVDWESTTANATLTLQASNDGLTWADLASTATILNNNGTSMLYATDFHYSQARVKIVVNSGTVDVLRLRVHSKGL